MDKVSENEAMYLKQAVEEGKNILVAGGTGAGKTAVLNALIDCIPQELTLATFEESAELQVDRTHVLRSEANGQDLSHAITFLLAQERPRYVAVDDIRGWGMFELAMGMGNTTKSIIVTQYAQHHYDALLRFLNQAIEQNRFLNSEVEIKQSIGKGLDLIVFTERLKDGKFKASIMEMIAYEEESDSFILKAINL